MTTDVTLIALFGATGTGKTTFVNDASGGNLQVGHKSHSCTQNVAQSQVFQVDGRNVVLFDSPGFDDTHLSDTEILKRIAGFLAASYKDGRKLTGIIYLHRITDIRVGGISRRTFNVFRRLCGKDSLSNVLIVTNMWSDPPSPQQIDREAELRDHSDFFQPALEEGATMVRRTHKNTESAHEIIRQLLKKEPIILSVQLELVDQGKGLADTGAGQEVERELIMAAKRHKAEMEGLKADMEKALRDRDERTQKVLAQFEEKARAEAQKRQAELESLKKAHNDGQIRWQKLIDEVRAERDRLQLQNRTVTVEFWVYAETTHGDNIFVVGNISQLGRWAPASSIAMSAAYYPTWTASVSMPAGSVFSYKYIRKTKSGSVVWESDPNRSATVPASGSLTLRQWWR